MEKLLPFLPQLVGFALKLGSAILEMTRDMTSEEMQKYLDMSYDEIAVKKRLKRDSNGKLIWH